MRPFDGRRVLLVVSGGIAAYKSAILVRGLRRAGAQVDVVLTRSGKRFVGAATFEALSGRPVHLNLWERSLAHIELGREADLAVVAPATADILARMAHGLADDMATATLLATACPLLVCPAMNVRMWEHPATQANRRTLGEYGVHFAGPEEGELAEGEIGEGRMIEPEAILAEIGRLLERPSRLAGRTVVVTAGPTRAEIDPVRFLGNRSSGRMGYELAASAWRRGADTVLITGPGSVPTPYGPRVVPVEESEAMLVALRRELEAASVLLMAAAVADFGPAEHRPSKIKKEGTGRMELHLVRGPDLLTETRELRERRGVFTLGFALETEDAVANARRKLESKGMDLVAVNQAEGEESAFDSPTNRVTLVGRSGEIEEFPLLPKSEVADRLLDRVEERIGG
ncbi:MAG: bifunctional phosphopantothenoylcysteine decarboxylase/phosphopantothenate--cysteine ligase CoaBC [Gemmatimonadota bacterium]